MARKKTSKAFVGSFAAAMSKIDKWREKYNSLRGLDMRKVSHLLEEADEGRFADLMWVMRKIEKRDPVVRAALRRLKSELKTLKWSVAPIKELPPGSTAAQADLQRQYLVAKYEKIVNLKKAIEFLALSDIRGYSHLEKHYDAAGDVEKLEPVFQWHWVRDGIYGDWLFNPSASQWPREAVPLGNDRHHFIIREVDDPAAEVLLISVVRKSMSAKDWDGFVEKYGIPSIFIILPPDMSEEQAVKYQDIAEKVASDSSGVLPNGTDMKSPPGGDKDGSVFEKHKDSQDKDIVLTITGGLLTMLTAPTGIGKGPSEEHSDGWDTIVAGIAKDIAETFQEQFDAPILAEAFPGQPVLCAFELAYPDAPEERGKIIEDASKLKSAGYRVKTAQLAEMTRLDLEEIGAEDSPGTIVQPLHNRAATALQKRRGKPDLEALATAAVADVLEVRAEILAPVQGILRRLLALAESDSATLEDFEKAATAAADTLPELFTRESVDDLAIAMEQALGPAVALGLRDAIRSEKKKN